MFQFASPRYFTSIRALAGFFTLVVPLAISAAEPVSFIKEIAPIFQQKCLACHGPEKTKGGFQLHTFESLMKGGESKEPSVTPNKPEKSKLFQLLTTKDADDRMPQKDDPLPPAQIALVERWIREGARFDGADPKLSLASVIPAAPLPDPPVTYSRPVPILALAFNPDGKELAIGGYHEVTIWDPSDGRLLRRIKNVAQRTQSLAYSPDGKWLAVAAGTPGRLGEVKLFDPSSASLVKTLAASADAMLAVCFNSNGTRIASGGTDNAIRIFNAVSGKQELLIEQHADWVMALAFSPDGAQLVSASRDKSARLFDSATGELEVSYLGHGDAVFAVAFSEDGKQVCSAGRDKEIHLWQVKDGKKNAEITGATGEIFQLSTHHDQLFSCSADKMARQYRFTAKKPELVRDYPGHKDFVYALSYHAPSGRLATAGFDGEVRIWQTEDGRLLEKFTAAPQ